MSATSTSPAYSKASRGTVYTLARQIAVRETQVLSMPISPYDVLTWIELRMEGITFSTLTLSNAI